MMRTTFQYPGTYGVDFGHGDDTRHRYWYPAPNTFDPGVLHPRAVRDGYVERGRQDQGDTLVRFRLRRDSSRANPVQQRLDGTDGRGNSAVPGPDSGRPQPRRPHSLQAGRLVFQHGGSVALSAAVQCALDL